jgi:hypothetical protein
LAFVPEANEKRGDLMITMIRMRSGTRLFGATAALLLSGCASMFLHGGRMADKGTPTAGALGSWDVQACKGTDGRPFNAPSGIRYFLFQGKEGLELFEQSADGSGSIITNQWAGSDGTHFYSWVTSNGWEFIIPGAGQPGVRRVYVGTGTTDSHPNGAWSVKCDLVPTHS